MSKGNYLVSMSALASARPFGGPSDTLVRASSGDTAPLALPKVPPSRVGHVHPQPRDLSGFSGTVAALASALGQDTGLGAPEGGFCVAITGDPALGAEHLIVAEPSQPRGAHRPSRRCPRTGFATRCPPTAKGI